jgi:hypothetical protein
MGYGDGCCTVAQLQVLHSAGSQAAGMQQHRGGEHPAGQPPLTTLHMNTSTGRSVSGSFVPAALPACQWARPALHTSCCTSA